jgi:hypothetical protein
MMIVLVGVRRLSGSGDIAFVIVEERDGLSRCLGG